MHVNPHSAQMQPSSAHRLVLSCVSPATQVLSNLSTIAGIEGVDSRIILDLSVVQTRDNAGSQIQPCVRDDLEDWRICVGGVACRQCSARSSVTHSWTYQQRPRLVNRDC